MTRHDVLFALLVLCGQEQPDDRIERELDKLAVSKKSENPYLKGTRLRTVAKKGFPGK